MNAFTHIADFFTAAVNWWINHLGQGLIALGLIAVVGGAVAVVLTVLDDRVQADDELLDRLGSAEPGTPTSNVDAVLLAARDAAEADPIPPLVDVDTAIAVINGGVL